MNTKPLCIYQYDSFAEFFSAYLATKKSESSGFSYRSLCRTLGIKSPSLIHWIAKGTRQPSPTMLAKLRTTVGLNADEYRYAQSLVGIHKSKSLTEKAGHAAVLNETRTLDSLTLDEAAVELVSKWFIVAILEMVALEGFQNDATWIRTRLDKRISELEVRQALQVLQTLGLIKADSNGRLQRIEKDIVTNDHTAILGARKFHIEMMNLAQTAINKQPPAERFYSGSTFNISIKHLPEAQEYLERTRREFINLFQTKSGDETYQFSMQFFRLTEPKTKKGTH